MFVEYCNMTVSFEGEGTTTTHACAICTSSIKCRLTHEVHVE